MRNSRVSVIVATFGRERPLTRCLAAHMRELLPDDELIVVGIDLPDDLPADIQRIEAAPDALTPNLWGLGLAAARGELVRITIASIVPNMGWRAAMEEALRGDVAGISGPIDPSPELRGADAALHCLRYRAFGSPRATEDRSDLPADHAAYRRAALDAVRSDPTAAFWEVEPHRALLRAGLRLRCCSNFGATVAPGISGLRFLRQRFLHGIHYGRDRLRASGIARRALFVLLGPLPMGPFAARIARECWRRPQLRQLFLRGLFWLPMYLATWGLGEWVGALRGPFAAQTQQRA